MKYAGARNLEYKGKIEDAIQRLMKAKEVYEQIQHPLLVPYINPIQMQNGFCLRFHWIDGECMHNHWDFTPFEKHHAPNSPFVKLRQLSVTERLNILTQIFEFAAYVESLGYVMVDFMTVVFYIILSNQNLRSVILISFKNLYSIKLGRIFGEQVVSKHLKNMNCMHKLQAKRMCLC